MIKSQDSNSSQEPSMYLQRPSASTSQDVRYILTHIFRDIFTRDAIRQDTIKNLQVSKHGSDAYHERYVDSLQSIHEEWQRRMDEAAMLERHIMQAQARAMSADERELNRVSSSCDDYQQLRLPPGYSHFRSCLDTNLLQNHNLLTPDDYLTEDQSFAPPPRPPSVPQYARDTVASQQHSRANLTDTLEHDMSGLGDDFTCVTSDDLCSEPSKTSETREVLKCLDDPEAEDSLEVECMPEEGKSEEELTESFQGKKHAGQPSWKKKMSKEQVDQEKWELEKMNSRTHYLLNRRHRAPSSIAGPNSLLKYRKLPPKPYNTPALPEPEKPPTVIFLASPQVVLFQEYRVGEVYEQIITLKNVSTVLRPLRVIPPSTSFFSVGLGQFPGEHGLVAPGMSCRFSLRFAPDSLKDYEDEVIIETQSTTTKLIIPLVGRRDRPILTLPPKLDVGHCLVGGYSITQFVVKNVGGPGRFCLLPRHSWPATNFKSVMKNGVASIPPFDVRPSTFELMQGQAGIIEIVFNPQKEGSFNQELTILCDNCQVQHVLVTGAGDVAKVELVSVEHGESIAAPGESNDAFAQHLIRFDELNPYTYTERTVLIKNCSFVDLPFQWLVCKPRLLPLNSGKEEEELQAMPEEPGEEHERTPDVDSVFSIHPPSGILMAGATLDFKVTFAPPRLDDYHSVLRMILQQIPQQTSTARPPVTFSQRHPLSPAVSMEGARPGLKSLPEASGSCTPSTSMSTGRDNMVNGSSTRVMTTDEEFSEDFTVDPYQGLEGPMFKDITGMEVEVKGNSVPVNVIFHPYAVFFPGNITLGLATKRIFSMANHSFTTITFQWEPYTDSHIIEVEPPFGELDPGMVIDLELSLTGVKPGKIVQLLHCFLLNVEEPFPLRIEAVVKGPEVIIEEATVDFGLVRLSQTAQQTITVYNKCHLPAKWTLTDKSLRPGEGEDEEINSLLSSEFTFTPSAGELRPLERKEVVISFQPTDNKHLKRVLQLDVEDGESSFLSVYGEVQSPQVCLLKCELDLPIIYVGVVASAEAKLLNQTLLPTTFHWGQAEGSDASRCVVTITPSEGVIEAREEVILTVTVFTKVQDGIVDLRIPCEVMGMDSPLYLGINTEVNGLMVEYCILDEAMEAQIQEQMDGLLMDFGASNKLDDTPKRILHIKNLSGIPAPFSIDLETFGAPSDFMTKQLSGIAEETLSGSQSQGLLRRTKNIADPSSKTASQAKKDFLRSVLSRDQGLVLLPNKFRGKLEAFGEQTVELSAFFNMWGLYRDTLLVSIGEQKELVTHISVQVGVVGCPLQFQMVANRPEQQPIVRFGTQICGTDVISRNMRINNNSPFDIRLDWQEYNIIPEDDKLLDLVVSYNRTFPVRDAEGNEILPITEQPWAGSECSMVEIPLPLSMSRRPSSSSFQNATLFEKNPPNMDDLPPDTPSTALTPGISRQITATTLTPMSYTSSRPKIVSLFLRSHEGQQCDVPFCLEPKQQVVPAHGFGFTKISFLPLHQNVAPKDLFCNAFALGYMSLDTPELLNTPGKVAREEAYHARALRLEMTAQLKAALLTVEYGDEEGLIFHSAMSDLLNGDELLPEALRVTTVTLSNNTETPVCFRVKVSLPFLLTGLDPGSTRDGSTRACETEMRRLLPRCKIVLHVAFRTSKDHQAVYAPPRAKHLPLSPLTPVRKSSLPKAPIPAGAVLEAEKATSSAELLPSGSAELPTEHEDMPSETAMMPSEDAELPNDATEPSSDPIDVEPTPVESGEELVSRVTMPSVKPQEMIQFDDVLEIQYDNSSVQCLPLRATLAIPQLQLSTLEVDFGTCFVGQIRSKEISIRNRTASKSAWKAELDSQCDGCTEETFRMEPTDGTLDAHITHVSDSERVIHIHFKPGFAQTYHAMFIFTGVLGEETQYVHVRGVGSFDGKHEAILDI